MGKRRCFLFRGKRLSRAVLPAAMVVGLVAVGCGPVSDPVAGARAPAPQVLAVELARPVEVVVAEAVGSEVVVFDEPSPTAQERTRLAHPTVSGAPLVFQVVELADDWLRVLLPIRPNGSTGWIRADDVLLFANPYRIEVDISDYRMTVFESGQPIETTVVAIGTGDTPTPVGAFYTTELLAPPDPDGAYGPFAFGLSGYSEVLRSFNGGEAIIGIHGTDEPESLGRDVSHGCVRVDNEVIRAMAAYLPLGTPVIISQ